MNAPQIGELLSELQSYGLSQESFPEATTWDDFIQNYKGTEDTKLNEFLRLQTRENSISHLHLADILVVPYDKAKEYIDQMTVAKRISILEDVQEYRQYLYSCTDRFGAEGLPREEQLSAHDYQIVMGKIKHLEILQNWLFGIM